MIRAAAFLLRALTVSLALAEPLGALEVRETIWGFDGRVAPNRFNPISVLVDNPSGAAFDGALSLSASEGPGTRRGEYVQPIFLAPRTARWVQFQVFIGQHVPEHTVRWGRGAKDYYELTSPPALGPPACIWLRAGDNPFAALGGFKAFPDELFPTTVAATDALEAVVLDHVPAWEAARREAFLDWVTRGGTVHLAQAADGRWPVFAEGLEALNSEVEVQRIGAGRVVRHGVGAREMNEKYLAERGYPAATFRQNKTPIIYDLESILFRRLCSLTRPQVSWPLIHLLALAYIAAIGPLHYRFRRRLDYRLSILLFLGVVALFATGFAVVGRRGYGESQTVHSLAIARALGGGRCDVTQWVSAFATTGDLYTLKHTSPSNLYATDPSSEATDGRMLNGKDGRIQMDIPLYSAQTFVHRGVMPGDDPSVRVEKWEQKGEEFTALRLALGPGFPKDFKQARAIVGERVYELVMKDGALQPQNPVGQLLSWPFSRDELSPLTHHLPFNKVNFEEHRTLAPLLAARALEIPDVFTHTITSGSARADLRLLVFASSPPTFHLRGSGFDRERGWVLYVQDVFKP